MSSQPSVSRGAIGAAVVILLVVILKKSSSDGASDATTNDAYTGEPREASPKYSWWMPLHEKLVKEAAEKPHRVIFYGDSITESLRGTSLGSPADTYAPNAAAFKDKILDVDGGKKYAAAALGIGGDQTAHLLWRLHHGEFPKDHPPEVAVILIGTNDLGWAKMQAEGKGDFAAMFQAVPTINHNMQLALKHIHSVAPKTRVLLVAVLPRANPGDGYKQPGEYTAAIEEVNRRYAEFAFLDQTRVKLVDCTAALQTPDMKAVAQDKMGDGLHPVGPGAGALLDCIKPPLDELLARVMT